MAEPAAFHIERLRHEGRVRALDSAAALALIAVGITAASLLFLEGRAVDLGYFTSTPRNFHSPVWLLFVNAVLLALTATAISFVLGLGIGFVTGWERSLTRRPLLEGTHGLAPPARALRLLGGGALYASRRVADFYVELVRGTPLLVQMFFVWEMVLVTAPAGWDLRTRSLAAGIAAMTINTGGYQSEIFRAGICAVPQGQIEAARAVGFRSLGAMRRVVLPQALRLVLPPLTNELVSLFKASSLLFFIGVVEVTSLSKTLTNLDPKIFELFLLTTALYLLVTIPVSRSVGLIEERYRTPGLSFSSGRRDGARRRPRTPVN